MLARPPSLITLHFVQVDDLEVRTVVCAVVPAKNASALIALLSAHLPIPDLKFLKRVRGRRPGEYPELLSGCNSDRDAEQREIEKGSQGTGGEAASVKGESDGCSRSSEKVLLAMIGPRDLVGKLQQEEGGAVYNKLTALCSRFFDGRVPAFPPNTREQFDEWSKVSNVTLARSEK